jgi:hypothetical protein
MPLCPNSFIQQRCSRESSPTGSQARTFKFISNSVQNVGEYVIFDAYDSNHRVICAVTAGALRGWARRNGLDHSPVLDTYWFCEADLHRIAERMYEAGQTNIVITGDDLIGTK